jgi:hypothetical protein
VAIAVYRVSRITLKTALVDTDTVTDKDTDTVTDKDTDTVTDKDKGTDTVTDKDTDTDCCVCRIKIN